MKFEIKDGMKNYLILEKAATLRLAKRIGAYCVEFEPEEHEFSLWWFNGKFYLIKTLVGNELHYDNDSFKRISKDEAIKILLDSEFYIEDKHFTESDFDYIQKVKKWSGRKLDIKSLIRKAA